jgi:ABC-type transporter Mla subunit MlaD
MTNIFLTDNITSTQKDIERLANKLDKSGDAIAATRLRKLNAALGGHIPFEDWAATDLQKVINPEAIATGIKSRATPGQRIRICEWLRNGLVLAPLILTWLGIWQASSKYYALDQSQTSQSFLYLWQGGFNHTLWPPFILSNLALTDCALLFFIFILTLFTTWIYNITNAQIEKDAEQLREQLTHALGDASLCLTAMERQRRQQQPSNLADISRFLFDFAQQFKQTSQQFLNELAEERKRRGDLNNFATRLETMVKDMVSASHTMEKTNAELTTTIKDVLVPVRAIPGLVTAAGQAVSQLNMMINRLGQLVGDQNKWRQELQDILAIKLEQLLTEQKQNGHDLHTLLANRLGQLLTEQNQAGQDLRNTLDAKLGQLLTEQNQAGQDLQNMLAVMLGQLLAEQKQAGQDLHTSLATSLGQLVSGQQSLGHHLSDAADTLEAVVTELDLVMKSLEDATKEQAKILTAMLLQQTAQKDLTDQMTQATAEIKQVLKEVRETSPELRSMSVDMDNFVRALRDVPNSLKAQLLDPLSHYSSAAANVAAGSGTLERVAQHLEHVASKLDGRLGP